MIMKRYGIHSSIINCIMNIYKQDETNIYFNGEKQTNIKIISGIRQGCNCSSTLFVSLFDHIKSHSLLCFITASTKHSSKNTVY